MSDTQEKSNQSLPDKYKLRGAQQVTYDDYKAAKAKLESKKGFQIPMFIKVILGAPFVLIFAAGILYIPYMLYVIATSPSAPPPVDKPVVESSSSSSDSGK